MTENCNRCGAEIVWAVTKAGKRIPVDLEPVATWKLRVRYLDDGEWHVRVAPNHPRPSYVSHFDTCPRAARHRA